MGLLAKRAPSRATILVAVLLSATFMAAVGTVRGSSPDGRLHSVDETALRAVLELPRPSLLAGSPGARTNAFVVPPGAGRTVIDDFESPSWPESDRWVYVGDLVNDATLAIEWSTSECRAAEGQQSLWAIGGGPAGAGQTCGTDYPSALQTSALLALDLSAIRSARALDLVFEAWADASPYEGLYVNLIEFDDVGIATSRRTVMSATGRSADWSEVRLDLIRLTDELDPGWVGDLRGQFAYFELLLLTSDAALAGEGMFVDELAVEVVEQPPWIVTPVPSMTLTPSSTPSPAATLTPTTAPTPADRTEACHDEPDCRSLEVRSFVDYACDGTYQNGVDGTVRSGPRVDIVAGPELLGTNLDSRGRATFRLPTSAGANVRMEVPDGYVMCQNSPNPLDMEPDDFRATGLTRVYLRVVPDRSGASLHADPSSSGGVLRPFGLPAVSVVDDFEDPSQPPTGDWQIDDEDGPPEYVWGRRDCHASSGQYGFWAVGAGTRGRGLECYEAYPADVRSEIRLRLDLSAYADAQVLNLAFELWANMESDSSLGDFLSINLIRVGEEGFEQRMPVYDWTGYTGEKFQTERLNLLDLANVFNPAERVNLAGEPDVVFEWRFRAGRDSTLRHEGPTIDDVRLEHDKGPTVTPTPETTPTHTRTPAPTPPTRTPTPEAGRQLFVPLAARGPIDG